jgi:hypothetical protein
MSNQPAVPVSDPADNYTGLRLLALAAVAAGVILLAAAAFVLSYSGIHAVALSAGVSPRLAKLYPLIFDAMLVVACAAVLALRTAGLPSRSYAWLSLIGLLVAAAAADALNATGVKLPHRPTAAVIAILPWALVLIGFGLLLCLLRHARQRRTAVAAEDQMPAVEPTGHVQMRTGLDDLLGPRPVPAEPSAGHVAVTAAPAPALTGNGVRTVSGSVPPPDLAIDLEPEPDDPAGDESADPEPLARVARIPRARAEPAAPAAPPAHHVPPAPEAGTAPATPPGQDQGSADAAGTAADTPPAGDPKAPGDPKPTDAPAPAAGSGPQPDAETTLDDETKAASEASRQDGTETERKPGQAPLLQFDRMRSSPIPPGT